MSVKGSRRGKSSHEQKPVGGAGGSLFVHAMKGITPVRGAAGGFLFLSARKSKTASTGLSTPSFEHAPRGASVTRRTTRNAGNPTAQRSRGRTIITSGR